MGRKHTNPCTFAQSCNPNYFLPILKHQFLKYVRINKVFSQRLNYIQAYTFFNKNCGLLATGMLK